MRLNLSNRALLPAVMLVALLFADKSLARTGDFQQPIDVKADRSEFNEKLGVQRLSGNVVIAQGTLKINAESIQIKLKDYRLSSIEGNGSPIRFEQQNDAGELISGEANSLVYDALQGRLTLSGAATLSEPKQNLRSERIVFDAVRQTVIAEGGDSGRVSITIQPPRQ
jgi:lipopolysaccharide export system protein LptA